jgi:hypothetical protein
VKQILLAILLTVFPLISFATDYYIATIDLNVRTGAGTGYSVSYTLQKGDEVEFLSKENNWNKINYSGRIGYAHSKYLKYSRTLSDTRLLTPQQKVPYLLIGSFVSLILVIVFILFRKRQEKNFLEVVTKPDRGTKSERDLVLNLLKYGIPAQHIFHDLYLEKNKGHFCQIDLAVITEAGIIVFEVKDYSGWIFGSGNQSQWTQVLNYGKQKYRFYNPVMQNNNHISELRKRLPFYHVPTYSVVVFYGDCKLKEINFVPYGTFITKSQRVLEVIRIILRDNKPVDYTANEGAIVCALKQAVINGGIIENQIQHTENIKGMLGKHRIFD